MDLASRSIFGVGNSMESCGKAAYCQIRFPVVEIDPFPRFHNLHPLCPSISLLSQGSSILCSDVSGTGFTWEFNLLSLSTTVSCSYSPGLVPLLLSASLPLPISTAPMISPGASGLSGTLRSGVVALGLSYSV